MTRIENYKARRVPWPAVLLIIGWMLLVVRRYAHRYRWIGWATVGILAVKIGIAGLHTVWLMMI